MLGGEVDYHPGNIGVVAKEIDRYEAVKIDHGRSATEVYSSEKNAREKLLANFKNWGYLTMPFNIEKFKEAMKDVTKISEDEISDIVQDRVYQLQKAKFKIDGIEFRSISDTQLNVFFVKAKQEALQNESVLKSPYDELAQHFERILKTNLASTKELVRSLEVISKIDKLPNQTDKVHQSFKYGGWLTSIEDKDPIVWAHRNLRTIEGKSPIVWACNNPENIAPSTIHFLLTKQDIFKSEIKKIKDPKKLTALYLAVKDFGVTLRDPKNRLLAENLESLLLEVTKARDAVVNVKPLPALHKFTSRQIAKMIINEPEVFQSLNGVNSENLHHEEFLTKLSTKGLDKMLKVADKVQSKDLKRTWGEFWQELCTGFKKIKNADLKTIVGEIKNKSDQTSTNLLDGGAKSIQRQSSVRIKDMITKLTAISENNAKTYKAPMVIPQKNQRGNRRLIYNLNVDSMDCFISA